jgi:hypothetical protein
MGARGNPADRRSQILPCARSHFILESLRSEQSVGRVERIQRNLEINTAVSRFSRIFDEMDEP